MANESTVESYLTGIKDTALQLIMKSVFKYALKDIRFGRGTTSTGGSGVACTNMGGGIFTAKTPSVANQEFTIQHSFGHAPYLLLQVMPLDQVNAANVRLTLSRAADATYIYLKSPETSQPVYVYLEG